MDERYILNYNNISPDQLSHPQSPVINYGTKRPAFKTGLDTREEIINNLHQNEEISKDTNRLLACSSSRESNSHQTILGGKTDPKTVLPNGKKTKGRVKIKMEFIDNKLRRYTTFSKRKTGIMKKAYELSTLTGTQVMLLVASETGHVYTFATRKLQPMITSESGKALIQTCLNSPDPLASGASPTDQRMSATGFEETELTYAVNEDESKMLPYDCELLGNSSCADGDEEGKSGSEEDSSPSISPRPYKGASAKSSADLQPVNVSNTTRAPLIPAMKPGTTHLEPGTIIDPSSASFTGPVHIDPNDLSRSMIRLPVKLSNGIVISPHDPSKSIRVLSSSEAQNL